MDKDKEVKEKLIRQSTEEMAGFCKRKGFVFQNSEIYGSFAGFYDYGPLGVELNNNIKNSYWKTFVQERDDVVGIDGAILSHPMVWKASGHVDNFGDILVECKKCHARVRGDHLINEVLKIQADGLSKEEINKKIEENNIKCQTCEGELDKADTFNLMLSTSVGPVQDKSSISYLRPETAQLIFTNYKLIYDTGRVKLPFGIAQIGKAFRNEISPRNFLFRVREFEQAEIEFFIHPKKIDDCPYFEEIKEMEVNIHTSHSQKNNNQHKVYTFQRLYDEKIIKNRWHAYWLSQVYKWFLDLGINPNNIRLREHLSEELAHYSTACFDIEYKFPFGWQEIHGMADRGTFDLTRHEEFSKKDLKVFDEETKEKVLGHVIEPSQGIGRALLTFLYDAYTHEPENKERDWVVLKLHPKLAPNKVAVLPLMKKDGLFELAHKIHKDLQKEFVSFFDTSGAIGRRYARQDEIGTPYCVTIDYDSKEKHDVTIRDRDSTKQVRIKITHLKDTIRKLINQEVKFEELT